MSRWPMVPLGEIAKPVTRPVNVESGELYRTIGVKWWGEGAYERQTIDGAETAARVLSLVRKNDLIINKIWVRHGSAAIATDAVDGCAASNEFPTFELNLNRVEPCWIHWLTKTRWFWSQCDALSMGTSGKNRIKPERFLGISIPLAPLAEQRRTAAMIDAVYERVVEAKRHRVAAHRERRALQVATISRIIDGLGLSGTLKDVLLAPPRNGWSVKCNGADNGVAVLGLGAITGFQYRRDQVKRTSEPTDSNAHYWLRRGDLLISRSNTPELIGHAAIYDGTPSPCIYPDLMMRLTVDPTKAEPKFVHYVLQSRATREFVKTHAKGTSATMKKISQGVVEAIPFPTRCGLVQQRGITVRLDAVTAMISSAAVGQAEATTEIDALLPSILDRAFSGDL